jgi:hypothetical protein
MAIQSPLGLVNLQRPTVMWLEQLTNVGQIRETRDTTYYRTRDPHGQPIANNPIGAISKIEQISPCATLMAPFRYRSSGI